MLLVSFPKTSFDFMLLHIHSLNTFFSDPFTGFFERPAKKRNGTNPTRGSLKQTYIHPLEVALLLLFLFPLPRDTRKP